MLESDEYVIGRTNYKMQGFIDKNSGKLYIRQIQSTNPKRKRKIIFDYDNIDKHILSLTQSSHRTSNQQLQQSPQQQVHQQSLNGPHQQTREQTCLQTSGQTHQQPNEHTCQQTPSVPTSLMFSNFINSKQTYILTSDQIDEQLANYIHELFRSS